MYSCCGVMTLVERLRSAQQLADGFTFSSGYSSSMHACVILGLLVL
jgi:hypothetical protein